MKANPFLAFFLLLLLNGGRGSPLTGQEDPSSRASFRPVPEVPVLLVPGWARGARELTPLKERFVRDGWPEAWVAPLEFEDPVGSNLAHAREIEVAIRALVEATGVPRVDVVAHSMGGLALWALLKEKEGMLPVRRVVFLGSPLQGTLIAYLAWGKGGEEMIPGSDFLTRLENGPTPDRWVEALTVRTPLDLTVVPNSGGTLPGMGDRIVCCPTHMGLQDHEETFWVVRDFLLGGRWGGKD